MPVPDTTKVDTIHVIFKTHLDIGFTDFAHTIIDSYITNFIPKAIAVAHAIREQGQGDQFVWTTGAWLIAEYLERANPAERRQLEQAIHDGDITWHALPFTTHTELMDPALFRYGLSISQTLDKRFGTTTIAAKLTDVPGHTRGMVPLLAEANIALVHIGVNQTSTPPDVPPVFVWRDPSGADVIVMYQRGSYGDLMIVSGCRAAIAFAHSNDNHGPQTSAQVNEIFDKLRVQFPNARVIGSTMDAFARQLVATKAELPVITGELGDTWIHGVGTDPRKVSEYRELLRLRQRWLADGSLRQSDAAFEPFSRALLMIPEHTWGLDVKMHLDDWHAYAPKQFEAARATAPFQKMEASWAEQRSYLRDARAALGDSPLGQQADERLAALAPAPPDTTGFELITDWTQRFETTHFRLSFDHQSGAIAFLQSKATGRVWSAEHAPLGLVGYEIFGQADYDRFYQHYNINKRATIEWSVKDFTKPGLGSVPGLEHRWWAPKLAALYWREDATEQHVIAELVEHDAGNAAYGCPRRFTLEWRLPNAAPEIQLDLQWFEKLANRQPEALWLAFVPRLRDPKGWRLQKLGELIAPHEVVRNGNRHLHAVEHGVSYRDSGGQLNIDTLDAPLVAPGAPALLDFSNRQPVLGKGIHINLYNNVWGTNFPMWYEEDARFRFVLRAT